MCIENLCSTSKNTFSTIASQVYKLLSTQIYYNLNSKVESATQFNRKQTFASFLGQSQHSKQKSYSCFYHNIKLAMLRLNISLNSLMVFRFLSLLASALLPPNKISLAFLFKKNKSTLLPFLQSVFTRKNTSHRFV